MNMKMSRKNNKKHYSGDRSTAKFKNNTKTPRSFFGNRPKLNGLPLPPPQPETPRDLPINNDQAVEIKRLQFKISMLNRQLLQKNRAQQLAIHQTITAYRQSLSFRIGWTITAPIRWIYDRFVAGSETNSGDLVRSAGDRKLLYEKVLEWYGGPSLNVSRGAYSETYCPELPEVLLRENALMAAKDKLESREQAALAKPKLLFIAPELPAFDESSGGKRAYRLLRLLSDRYRLLVYTTGERKAHHLQQYQQNRIEVIPAIQDPVEIKLLHPRIEVIVYAWYYSYLDHMAFSRLYPEARTVIDTVDVHWVREMRSIDLVPGLTLSQVMDNKKGELFAYANADLVWAVTERDKATILKELPKAKVEVVSNIHEVEVEDYFEKEAPNIVFFGGYQHPPNLSAVQQLADEIFPLIRKKIPDAQLILAGSKAPETIRRLGKREGIKFLGFLAEDEVDDFYASAALTIVPLLAGAGIKGKICEAICYRVPVLTNAIGNEGIDLVHGYDGFLADTSETMAESAVRILSGQYDLKLITDRAVDKIQCLVGPKMVKQNMLRSLLPAVSICIVTWNRKALVQACIESILNYTVYPNYKILVHSNGCTDGTQQYLREAAEKDDRIEPILSATNDVFVLPNNRMMERYPESDIVLLNNDVTVTPNWLLELYRAAYLSEKIGISGSKILYPDGRLQEFGAELYADGTGRNIGKFQDAADPPYSRLTTCGYVSGCAMYIKRTTIERIGTFDERFHPCYCEDSDYCYTAKEQGLATVVTPKSIVYHYEGATSGRDTESGFKAYQMINMQKFLEKHRDKANGIDWHIPESESIEE